VRKIVSILVLVSMLVMLFSACAKPAPTPVPPAPTAVPVEEAEEAEEEPTEEVAPEPFTLVWYTGHAAGCINQDYCIPECEEPGCLGDWQIARFHELYPQYDHVTIEYIYQTEVGGLLPPDLDTLIAAGETPNMIDGYGGRIGRYAAIGLNFDEYLDDDQKADFLNYEGMFFGDTMPMIEASGNFAYFTVNATLVGRACAQEEFECGVPEPWSIVSHDEFLEIGRAIKALDDGSYLGLLFGMNASSQHLQWLWFAQVGVQAFESGVFTGLNTPETRAVMKELIDLYDDGQFMPGAPGLCDDDYLVYWGPGKIAFAPWGLPRHASVIAGLVESGELEEAWEIVPIAGIQFDEDIQPLMSGSHFTTASIVTAATPEEHRKAAVDFAHFTMMLHWVEWVNPGTLPGTHPSNDKLRLGDLGPAYDYIAEHGLADVGVYNPHYNEIRSLFADLVAAMTAGVKSPTEAMFTLEQIGKALMEE